MRYLAKVKKNRDGAKLTLYLIIWFIHIPIGGYGRYIGERVWFMIEEDLVKWRKYYGDKLTIIDNRELNIKGIEAIKYKKFKRTFIILAIIIVTFVLMAK